MSENKETRLQISVFRDSHGRLRASLRRDGRIVDTKPAERVWDGAPQEERHAYNLFKVFDLYMPNAPLEKKLRLLNGEEVEFSETELDTLA